MSLLNTTLLPLVDRSLSKLGLLDRMVEALAERVIPRVIAQACFGHFCYYYCDYSSTCRTGYWQYAAYGSSAVYCQDGTPDCFVKTACVC
jgi:hypothetical protein